MFHVPYHRENILYRESFSDASTLHKKVIISNYFAHKNALKQNTKCFVFSQSNSIHLSD
jgi:hypothetical protein